MKNTTSEHGLCLCGCGQLTRIAPVNDKSKGWIKGTPLKYMMGHRLKAGASGEKSPRWKGGKSLSTHGYVVVWTTEGRQYEHILMAEKALGRKLKYISPGHADNEVVHHIDGDKAGNRVGNILICTHSYHMQLHHRLELSDDWPQFAKITRNDKRVNHANR